MPSRFLSSSSNRPRAVSNLPNPISRRDRIPLETKGPARGTAIALGTVVTRLVAQLALLAASLSGATLEKLSFDEMVNRSTAIVRATVGPGSGRQHGALVYTHHRLTVLESWKGNPATSLEVVVPGGQVGRLQHSVAGAPVLTPGSELVLFLWTSRSGITHVIGLSQGVFQLERSADGTQILNRAPVSATLVAPSGRPVHDDGMTMPMTEFRTRVSSTLARTR